MTELDSVRHLPDRQPILDACRRAIAQDPVAAVSGLCTSPQGRHVRLTSPASAARALAALRAFGYDACADPNPALLHAPVVLVRGWDVDRLRARADRLETAIDVLVADALERTRQALARYRKLTEQAEYPAEAAHNRVIGEVRRAIARELTTDETDVPTLVADIDRHKATGELRQLLDRVAAAELAMLRLAGVLERAVDDTLDLFRKQPHAEQWPGLAAAATENEIAEGIGATLELARKELAEVTAPPELGTEPLAPRRQLQHALAGDSGPAAVDPMSVAVEGLLAELDPDLDTEAIVDLCLSDYLRPAPNHWDLVDTEASALSFPNP